MDWAGPDFVRQPVPDTALFRTATAAPGGTNRLEQGLDYRCYEGDWSWLPDFDQLPVVKTGNIANFDLRSQTRETFVGLVFNGWIKVLKPGTYTLWTRSDDGSRLYLDDLLLKVRVLGPVPLPAPLPIFPGEIIREEQECRWAELEGTVSGANRFSHGTTLELESGMRHSHLTVVNGDASSFGLLLHSRIRARGICQTAIAPDGQAVSSVLVPDWNKVAIMEIDPARWLDYPARPIGLLMATNSPEPEAVAHISGIVATNVSAGSFVLEDNTGSIAVDTTQNPPNAGARVEALGVCSRRGGTMVLRGAFHREVSGQPDNGSVELPLLTKAIQIMSLSRAEAQRGYPVRIRGVVTASVGSGYFIQDPTWSIYVSSSGAETRETPRVGDYWEVEGNSSVHFAPDVQLRRAFYLGPGKLPEPIRPTWDELVNGSLATKYVEIQGIAAAVKADDLVLLTREGTVQLLLDDWDQTALKKLEGALVRVRGVGSPARDTNQMIMMMARLRLYNATANVDEPAPADAFDIPLKQASDLLLFDPRADALRRIKVAGQILQDRPGEYFLTDRTNGFRFRPKDAVRLRPGDLVEVVGFPDMSGPAPVLLEALVHVTGKTNLPDAVQLSGDALLNGKLDSTRVRVESRLVGLSTDHSDHILELLAGTRSYIARLPINRGTLSGILPGSLLELTGVYAGHGGDRASSRGIDSFELLLGTAADIQVLERPSWWTARHTLTVIGGLVLVILVALIWNTQLRRQVEERSMQLASEIKSRELAERQRAMEEERTRIAQDLHDDLGATLTEIRFLSAVKSRDSLVPETTRSQLLEVSEKSRQMVSSLDEIVWAVNPANDSLPSLTSYLRHVAEEFFRATNVRCRLDVEPTPPPVALTSEVRHNLYLAVREALNNVAKHSHASEAWLRIHWKERTLLIAIEDNGLGFNEPDLVYSGNGLRNMERRMERIGGRFECDSRPGSGTSCRIYLPFAPV